MNDEWITRAAKDIAGKGETLCGCDRCVETVAAIIAAEHSRDLCEKLNAVPKYRDSPLGMRKSGTADWMQCQDVAEALGIDTNGRGFRPKGES